MANMLFGLLGFARDRSGIMVDTLLCKAVHKCSYNCLGNSAESE